MNLSTSAKTISFLIPFYNEENTLRETIVQIISASEKHLQDYEIILVNDGSTDSSEMKIKDLLKRKDIRYHAFSKNLGFGAAYVQALALARLPFVMYLCADGDVTSQELCLLLHTWDGKSALLQYCDNLNQRSYSRRLLSKLYTKSVQILSRTRFPYYNGFNILPTARLQTAKIQNYGFSTQAYILLQAISSNCPVQTVGTFCRFNDENSKALTVKNFLSALYFYCYMMRTKWIPSSLNQL